MKNSMKRISLTLIGLCFSMSSFAGGTEVARPQGLLELDSAPDFKSAELMAPEGGVDDDSWSHYLSDYCIEERELRFSAIMGHDSPSFCMDGTVSYDQPKSTGLKGWEGKCGQTAASNIIYGLCGIPLDPTDSIGPYMRDFTPGVAPDTLKTGLQEIFTNYTRSCSSDGVWKWYSNQSAKSFEQSLKYFTRRKLESGKSLKRMDYRDMEVKRTPVALLIRDPGSHNLHWITLVDIEEPSGKCVAVVNHWDNQYKTPCSTLAKWSKGVADSYPLIFRPYNMVVLRD